MKLRFAFAFAYVCFFSFVQPLAAQPKVEQASVRADVQRERSTNTRRARRVLTYPERYRPYFPTSCPSPTTCPFMAATT